ncbi:HNH endonuclease [Neorhizobium alkalisoli]|uniref:HNH endonuclease n=1 Tax=Neorhizobium alkalisoli TaxID=528178 RepID=UPI00119F9F9E|nr:HNH endonuclease signature motif containing protein [Neorhizobium alkalisoli]
MAHNQEVAGSSPAPATKSTWHHLYQTVAWKRLREHQLAVQPLCEFCLITEDVTAAEVVDHKKPHKGDFELFHDPLNLQSLCAHHHNSAKQLMERGRKVAVIGVDGYPIEIG